MSITLSPSPCLCTNFGVKIENEQSMLPLMAKMRVLGHGAVETRGVGLHLQFGGTTMVVESGGIHCN